MAETLRDLRARLRRRMDELRPLVDEFHQLERAAAALGVSAPGDGEPAPRPAPKRKGKPKAKAKGGAGKRAPRGANRAAVLAVVGERPGVSVGEIASVTGIAKAQVYSITRAALAAGDLEHVDLGGGRKGFKAGAGGGAQAGGGRSLEEGAEGIEDPTRETPVGG